MRHAFSFRAAPLLAVLLSLSCAPALDDEGGCDDAARAGPLSVQSEPEGPLDALPRVVHLRARGREGPLDPAAIWLIEGDVGSGYLSQLARGAPSKNLLERVVPATRWLDGDALVIAPSATLMPGERYSLANDARMTVPLDVVADDSIPLLPLAWPPAGRAAGALVGVWCADDLLPPLAPRDVVLGPHGVTAHFASGALADGRGGRCLRLTAGAATAPSLAIPPPHITDADDRTLARLEPTPLSSDAEDVALTPLTCDPGEVALGPGCATVEDDRIWIRAPDAPLLWAFEDGHGLDLVTAAAGGRMLVAPVPPATTLWLSVSLLDLAGIETSAGTTITTASPMPHLVISEVMANPVGPEPEQEWIEVYNDGLAPAQLEGWQLEDIGGAVTLPAAWLAAGAYALIVDERYDASAPYDPLPPTGTPLVRVPSLGSNGLNNQGEPLTLRDAGGEVVSQFPALPKPKSGRSVIRLDMRALEADPDAFALSDEGASTPGTR